MGGSLAWREGLDGEQAIPAEYSVMGSIPHISENSFQRILFDIPAIDWQVSTPFGRDVPSFHAERF
jgi:hypothetical protein